MINKREGIIILINSISEDAAGAYDLSGEIASILYKLRKPQLTSQVYKVVYTLADEETEISTIVTYSYEPKVHEADVIEDAYQKFSNSGIELSNADGDDFYNGAVCHEQFIGEEVE